MTDSSATSSTQTVSRGSRPGWLLLVAGLVVAVLAWSATRSGDSDSADSGEEVPRQATTQPESAEELEAELVIEEQTATLESDAAQADSVSSDAAQPDQAVEPFDATARVELVDGPVVGSGLTLVFGSPLRFVDLETGEAIETSLTNRLPVARVDDVVILANLNSGGLESIDLDDLGAPPVGIGVGEVGPRAVAPGNASGTIVVVGYGIQGEIGERRYTFDTATGEVLESVAVDAAAGFGNQFGLAEFFSPRTGGVYLTDVDGLSSRVAPGRLVAQGSGLLLVDVCDELLVCETTWFNAETLAPVDRFVPDDILSGQVLANGRLLAYEPKGVSRLDLMDLETGELLLVDFGNPGTAINGVSVSPDDRYLAYSGRGGAIVVDLDSGNEFEIRIAGTGGPGALLMSTAS